MLAGQAPEHVQQRALARYTFLYADDLLEWLRRWRNALSRSPETARAARDIRPLLTALADALAEAGDVRDYLAAKRQSVADLRADDMQATVLLWAAVNGPNVQRITDAAVTAYDALNNVEATNPSIIEALVIDPVTLASVAGALPFRDPDCWYLAVDTSADLRPYTLAAAQGGELGRRIAQINDVVSHLDVLLRIAPVVHNVLPYDWLVRSAMVVEINTLLDLTLGPPPSGKRNVAFPLIDLCRLTRARDSAAELERLRGSLAEEGWDYVRWARNSLGAHVDERATLFHLHAHLIHLDYPGIVRLAEYLLDWLDGLACAQLDLRLLALTERRIGSWKTQPRPGDMPTPPADPRPGALASLFRSIDSPFMIGTSWSMGSALVAGFAAGRKPVPRTKASIPRRWYAPLDRPPMAIVPRSHGSGWRAIDVAR